MNQRLKVVLILVGVFLAGAVCGGPIALRFLRPARPEWNRGARPQVMDRLSKELDLTQAQQEKIRPIVTRAQEEMQHFRRESIRNIAVVMDRMHTDVAAELTPEQRSKLEDMRKKFRDRAERIRGEFRNPDRADKADRPVKS
jgi:Spy/CpxP family protein refolding chaperone